MEVTPTSRKGTLGTWWFRRSAGQSDAAPTMRLTYETELSFEQTTEVGAYADQRLNLAKLGRLKEERPRLRTGPGKSGRPGLSGGLGKRGHDGKVNPPRNRKGEAGNPPSTTGALEFYPNNRRLCRWAHGAGRGRCHALCAWAASAGHARAWCAGEERRRGLRGATQDHRQARGGGPGRCRFSCSQGTQPSPTCTSASACAGPRHRGRQHAERCALVVFPRLRGHTGRNTSGTRRPRRGDFRGH